MTFNDNDKQMIEFGRFTVYQSLKEMVEEHENLNAIDYNELANTALRNIQNEEILAIIDKILEEDEEITDWREDLR